MLHHKINFQPLISKILFEGFEEVLIWSCILSSFLQAKQIVFSSFQIRESLRSIKYKCSRKAMKDFPLYHSFDSSNVDCKNWHSSKLLLFQKKNEIIINLIKIQHAVAKPEETIFNFILCLPFFSPKKQRQEQQKHSHKIEKKYNAA